MDNENKATHTLNCMWTLWAHLPHDTSWKLPSYKKIMSFNSVEEVIVLTDTISHKMVRNCMLFIMRGDITPMWEDPLNKEGGSFSYKVSNKIVPNTWKDLTYKLVGESLIRTTETQRYVNGITISPKKNFCVIKIWMANCDSQDSTIIGDSIQGIESHGCLFKKHNPVY
jgi:hypothetical protein